jgi:hypothetical protein
MTIAVYASQLAARIPQMQTDSAINNAYMIQGELEALFRELTEQRDPSLRSRAELEIEAIRQAFKTCPDLPKEVWIGDDSDDDRVLWLIRRLLSSEAAFKSSQARLAAAEDACRAVIAWREGPEGPTTLFEQGSAMLKLVRDVVPAG